jgi:hypothetical protein
MTARELITMLSQVADLDQPVLLGGDWCHEAEAVEEDQELKAVVIYFKWMGK